jgi:hypothetical protein
MWYLLRRRAVGTSELVVGAPNPSRTVFGLQTMVAVARTAEAYLHYFSIPIFWLAVSRYPQCLKSHRVAT